MDSTRLKQWMDQNDIGNNELARLLDVSPGLVSLYVNSDRPASASFKWRFLQQFGLDAATCVFGEIPTAIPEPTI